MDKVKYGTRLPNVKNQILGQNAHGYHHVERPLQDTGDSDPHLTSEAGAGQSLRGHLIMCLLRWMAMDQLDADIMHRQIIK